MVQLKARGVKFIYSNEQTETNVHYTVGNCKLTDKDIDTLLALRKCCRENPTKTIDLRKAL